MLKPTDSASGALNDALGRYRSEDGLEWPSPVPSVVDRHQLRDLYRGCIVWGAVGDALGRPAETLAPDILTARYGPNGLREFVAWPGWTGGPKGTFTDDTQLTVATAESLIATGGVLDADDLVQHFLAIGHIRGIGRATSIALTALRNGAVWSEAGQAEHSAGNGAAMRAAPIGLVHAFDATPDSLVRDAVLSALPTHTHAVAVAGAVAVAASVAFCLRGELAGDTVLNVDALVAFLVTVLDGIEPGPTQERKPGGKAVRLSERLGELPDLLTWPSEHDVLAYTYNGAFALESVPAALYCFLRSPSDVRKVILTAVNAGYDADTVASMAGNLAGAWRGASELQSISPSWWVDLEDRDVLIALGDRLADLALDGAAK